MRYTLVYLFLLLPTLALAQAPPTSVIPYSGTLFSQGKPVSQDTDVLMAFALYSGDAITVLPAGSTNEAPDVALADENPSYNRLWTSWTTEDGAASQLSSLLSNNPDTVGVKVRNGRFLVHLGASGQTALPDSVFDQRPLYVVTWVVNTSGAFRLPPQALDKVPHAVTAERANSFEVMGDLNVQGNASIAGNISLPFNAEINVNSSQAGFQSKILQSGWATDIGDFVSLFIPGQGNPIYPTLRLKNYATNKSRAEFMISANEGYGALLSDVTRHSASSSLMTSPQNFSVTVSCPSDRIALAGGMERIDGNNTPNSIFYESIPSASNGWIIQGYNGRSDRVIIKAWVTCARIQ